MPNDDCIRTHLGVRHHGVGRLVLWPQAGWELDFPIQFSEGRVINDSCARFMLGVLSLISMTGLMMGTSYTQEAWLRHPAPCRDVKLQHDQMVDNELRSYSMRLQCGKRSIETQTMETEWVALDLRTQNSKSADARDGIFVVVCSPTTSPTPTGGGFVRDETHRPYA